MAKSTRHLLAEEIASHLEGGKVGDLFVTDATIIEGDEKKTIGVEFENGEQFFVTVEDV